jgi:hypothetical protein
LPEFTAILLSVVISVKLFTKSLSIEEAARRGIFARFANFDEAKVDVGANGYLCDYQTFRRRRSSREAMLSIPPLSMKVSAVPAGETLHRKKPSHMNVVGIRHSKLHECCTAPCLISAIDHFVEHLRLNCRRSVGTSPDSSRQRATRCNCRVPKS